MTTASTVAPEPEPPRRPWAAIGLLAAILAAQTVESVRLFPTPRALLDDDHPVLEVDHAIHLYHGALGSRFLIDHGTPWGFDPYFMAGYPVTPVWDSSSNPSILFQALAGGGYHPRAYNIGLFVCSLVALASLPAGAAAAGLGLSEAALAALLGWLYLRCGWPDMFVRSGLFAFVTASCEAVLLTGLLLGYEGKASAAGWGALTAAASVLVFTHVTGPLLSLGAGLGLVASAALRHSWRWSTALVAAALTALAVNLFWLVPLWTFRGIRSPLAFFMAPGSAWAVVDHYLAGDLEGRLGLALVALGLAGLIVWMASGQRVWAATFGGAALSLLVLAAFGGQWSITTTLEPFRFLVPFHLLMTVPAGSVVVQAGRRLARALGGGLRGTLAVASGGLVALAVAGLAFPQWFRLAAGQIRVDRPLVAGLRPEMEALVRSLRQHTDPSARILFEDQLRLLEATDPESTHWTPLLPELLGRDSRQFIGGLYQTAFIAHHRAASFGDFTLGGIPIDAWPPERLRAFCDQYNIGWVVCWSPLSRLRFDYWGDAHRVATVPRHHTPGLVPSVPSYVQNTLVARLGPALASQYLREGGEQYVLYRIDRPHTFFLKGQGQLAAAKPNQIELAGVVPERGEVVLSLHWLDTWRTDPPLRVTPISVPNDPVPFVKISMPERLERLWLRNGY